MNNKILSMTGFATALVHSEHIHATWELRSVNHRYLELNFKLPEFIRPLESQLRPLIASMLARGKIDITLRLQAWGTNQSNYALNETLAKELMKHYEKITELGAEKKLIEAQEVLKFPGVIAEVSPQLDNIQAPLFSGIEQALNQLIIMRANEGERLAQMISSRLASLKNGIFKIKQNINTIQENLNTKLMKKINSLKLEVDPQRLAQEVIFYAQRSDIAEEIDRIETHINSTENLLKETGPKGRKLDFLMQELHRETNTMAAKATASDLSVSLVNFKVLIEQMREQVQNIE